MLSEYDNDSFIPFGDDCPLPSVKEDWAEELPALLDHLSDPHVMDKKQQAVIEWYTSQTSSLWRLALNYSIYLQVENSST